MKKISVSSSLMLAMVCALGLMTCVVSAQTTLFSDDFSGNEVDTNKWTVFALNGGYAAVVSNNLTINHPSYAQGVFLTSQTEFTAPYKISGTFKSSSSNIGVLNIRANGSYHPVFYNDPYGITLAWYFGQSFTANLVREGPDPYVTLANTNLPYDTENFHSFDVYDFGNRIRVDFNGATIADFPVDPLLGVGRQIVLTDGDNWSGGSTEPSLFGPIVVTSLNSSDTDSDGDGLSDAWERGFGRYQVIPGNFTWAQADADARSRDGHLATVGSATEWTFIKQLRAGHPYNGLLWLGGTDADSEGLWKWIDGTAWTFEAWGGGEPNNAMDEDRLMMLSATDNYVWNDLHGELDPFGYGTFGYLLEFGYPTDPFKADTDDDGYNDKVESDNGSDPNNAAATPVLTDRDKDGVNYYREIADGTNPNDAATFNPLSKGLVAYYPFNGNADDESGNGNHCVVNGAVLDTDSKGEQGKAYTFNGTSDFIEMGNAPSVNFGTNDFTLSAWVKPASDSINRYIISKYHTGTIPSYGLGTGFSSAYAFLWCTNQVNGASGGEGNQTILDDHWHLLTATYTRGEMLRIYIDGRLDSTKDISACDGDVINSLPLVVGALADGTSPWGRQYFKGAIDNIRIYNRTLYSNEVEQLFFTEAFTDTQRGFLTSAPSVMGHYSQTAYDDFGALQFSNGVSLVLTNPSAFNLFTEEQYNSNRTAGQSDVISNPMSYGLYTSNSIMDLRMGGLMIQRQGTNAVVSFQPQTTTDLALPFTNNGTPIAHEIPMPGNKGFIRINAKPAQSVP